MAVEFTAHNIRLDDGTFTKPEMAQSMEDYPWLVSARRLLDTVFPGDKSRFRLADLGCLEGGYAVEFARMGFQVLGLEVRDLNVAACRWVQERTHLPNLEFVQDDAWNVERYGPFDAVFCCGLLYHFDRPRRFLEILSRVTTRALILQTHFSTERPNEALSGLETHEGLEGRWYTEFQDDGDFAAREAKRWASWDNRRSFWIRREHLLQAIHDVGFDLILEQFDSLAPGIAEAMTEGPYRRHERGTFIGIKTGLEMPAAAP
jgi:SAM-dependent methyltransferase